MFADLRVCVRVGVRKSIVERVKSKEEKAKGCVCVFVCARVMTLAVTAEWTIDKEDGKGPSVETYKEEDQKLSSLFEKLKKESNRLLSKEINRKKQKVES